jgi:diacylglycerol kinase (ATP)
MSRIIKAFFYSLAGIKAAWQDEAAFRQEALLAAILIPLAFVLAPDKISLILMAGSVLLVLIVELLNTGIEAAINRIGSEVHPLSKKAKDSASAAVLLSLLLAGFVWLVCLT